MISFRSALPAGVFLRSALAACLLVVSTGCGNVALRNWRYDNQSTRKLQAASVSGLAQRPIAGETFDGFFKDKVILIGHEGIPIPSGRGVPLTEDGYVLTAWHVVDEGNFQWTDTVQLKPLPEKGGAFRFNDYFRVTRYPGRVVWRDRDVDLAIVKFGHRPSAVLKAAEPPLAKGTAVFSGASGMNGGVLLATSARLEEGIGNGPFKTAGKVTRVRRREEGIRRYIYHSTLVARGGMSGGPVVDDQGRLAGIVTRIRWRLFTHPVTLFTMADPALLEEIIREDRKRHR